MAYHKLEKQGDNRVFSTMPYRRLYRNYTFDMTWLFYPLPFGRVELVAETKLRLTNSREGLAFSPAPPYITPSPVTS